jgi:hypothetical protein
MPRPKRKLRLRELNLPGLFLLLVVMGLISLLLWFFLSWVASEIHSLTSGPPSRPVVTGPASPGPTAGRHHHRASHVLGLRCDTSVQGSECGGKVYGPIGAVALDITGVSANEIYAWCLKGYEVDWSDNHGRVLSRDAAFGCTPYSGVQQVTIDQTTTDGTGVPYVYITAPEPPYPANPPWAGPWRITMRLISPSGATVLTLSYQTTVVAN